MPEPLLSPTLDDLLRYEAQLATMIGTAQRIAESSPDRHEREIARAMYRNAKGARMAASVWRQRRAHET